MPRHTQWIESMQSATFQSTRAWRYRCTCGDTGKPRGSKGVALRDANYHRELQRIIHPAHPPHIKRGIH